MHALDNLVDDLKEIEEGLLDYSREFIRDLEFSSLTLKEFSEDLVFTLNADNSRLCLLD